MKKIIMAVMAICIASTTFAQALYFTKTGKIQFTGRSKVEKIDAVNNEVSSMFNTSTGEVVFAVLMKGFHFERALMEEHFNENYVESTKFPKATYKGKITNVSAVNFTKDGQYTASSEGELTIHGVTKKVTAPATVVVKSGKVAATSKLSIKLNDYGITIPSLVADKISNDVDVVVDCKYEKK